MGKLGGSGGRFCHFDAGDGAGTPERALPAYVLMAVLQAAISIAITK
jgi:hypothetical protein